jgi:hypothetical protein
MCRSTSIFYNISDSRFFPCSEEPKEQVVRCLVRCLHEVAQFYSGLPKAAADRVMVTKVVRKDLRPC